jgi:hypothetical protein
MSGKKRRKASNPFQQAVSSTPDLGEDAYCSGLRALTGSDSGRIVPGEVSILGSVNLDAALRLHYPNDARWDYGIGIQKAASPGHSGWRCTLQTLQMWTKC